MSWRNFKNLFKHEKFNESQFILGIDIGDATSAISYFDANKKTTEIIDISGGYGKTTIPTAMQYLEDSQEWIFGEYAILNQGIDGETMLTNFIRNLGSDQHIEIENEKMSITDILGIYINELINSCKNINPKAEVVGIVVSTPNYFKEKAKQELINAFHKAGFAKEVIDFIPYRECLFAYQYFNKKVSKENILMLDFGSRGIRGGIYTVKSKSDEISVETLSYMSNEDIGSKKIENVLTELFTSYYQKNKNISKNEISKQDMDCIRSFVYQHKDLVFQKNVLAKPIKLYFNFAFPPFQESVTNEQVANIVSPFKQQLELFLEKLVNSGISTAEPVISFGDIDTVLCTGGGFEMFWPRTVIEDIFPDSNINFYKNSKVIAAEGAAILAAGKLGIIDEKTFKIKDLSQVEEEIGIYITKNKREKQFLPIIKKGSFWWQQNPAYRVIINQSTDKPCNIELIKRDIDGNFTLLTLLELEGLPLRPAGTTRLKMTFDYISHKKLRINIVDDGFGELFEASDYNVEYFIPL